MDDICINSASFTKGWFNNLTAIQGRMMQLSHTTKANAKAFSQQTLKDVFLPDADGFETRKANLSLFCRSQLGLMVPDTAYEDLAMKFLDFVGLISIPADKPLSRLFYCVAGNLNSVATPEYSTDPAVPTENFMGLKLAEAFTPNPLDTNPVLQALDRLLRANALHDFYPDSSALSDLSTTVRATVNTILE